ncbi:MAG: hypothetical protein ACYDG4_04215 [Desulfuromonadaceae bacterium]
MDANSLASITTGITDSQLIFYTIGGTLLVVMASIWGFKKIVSLLTPVPEWKQRGYSSQADAHENQAYFADKR